MDRHILNNKVNIAALVPALKQGNPPAWERFVRYMSPRAIRYFCAHGVDSHTAEDLAQETFLRASKHIGQLRMSSRVVPWTYSIMRTTLLEWVDAEARMLRRDQADVDIESLPDRAVGREPARNMRLLPGLDGLSHDDADLLHLRYVAEFSVAECARLTERSNSATRLRLWRLVSALKKSGE